MSLSVGLQVLFCVFLTNIKGSIGVITVPPSNAVAEPDGQAIFYCEASSYRGGWFLSKDGSGSQELFLVEPSSCQVKPGFEAHYSTDQSGVTNACNLIVTNITMEEAGVYRCAESAASHAILTVIDKSPITTYNVTQDVVVENEKVIITCTTHHNGSVTPAPTLRPYFYWTDSSGQNVSSSYDSTTQNTAVSQITVTARRPNITPYTCHVYLQLDSPTSPGYENNIPVVSNSASSPPIDVLYYPSSPVVTSESQIITIHGIACEVDILTCNSTGNPPPTYEWLDSKENVILSTDTRFDLAEIRNYTCLATNIIRNEMHHKSSVYAPTSASTIEDCKFPHSDSTTVNVTGCDNGTCTCSNGYDGLTFTCNTDSYPNASYQWIGVDKVTVYSKVYNNITLNGLYYCTAYFNQTTSNYTGNLMFTNGTNEENVTECCEIWELVISAVIPFLIKNLIAFVVFIVCINRIKDFSDIMTTRFHWMKQFEHCAMKEGILWCIVFVIGSVAFGLIVIPVLITIAFCCHPSKGIDSSDKEMKQREVTGTADSGQYANAKERDENREEVDDNKSNKSSSGSKSKWVIILIWCVAVVALIPVAFIVVYFVFCNQMLYEVV